MTYKSFELYSKEQAESVQDCGLCNLLPKRVLNVLDQLQAAPMETSDRAFLMMAALLQGNQEERESWSKALQVAALSFAGKSDRDDARNLADLIAVLPK